MTTTLRICEPVMEALRRHHLASDKRVERLSYVFGRRVDAGGHTSILVPTQSPILFADDCFVHQSSGHVSLDPAVLNAMLVQFAASDWDVIVNVHDHWFSHFGTRFSPVDDADDLAFARYLSGRFEPMLKAHPDIGPARTVTLAAIVLDGTTLDARIVDGRIDSPLRPIDRLWLLGERVQLLVPNSVPAKQLPDVMDRGIVARQADFVSDDTRRALASTRFALAGCGGMGSILAEGLVRLGARRIMLFDEDTLELSNLNRWQGGIPEDVGRNKAEVLAARIRQFAPDVEAEVVPCTLHGPRAHQQLRGCDIIVGALDNDVARFVLNRHAQQYLLPYFDASVRVHTGERTNFHSRYFCVLPGTTGCLECTRSNLIDREAVALALQDPLSRASRRAAGYIDNAPEASAPSVYALNMRAASVLLTELLNCFAGYRRTATTAFDSWQRDLACRHDGDSFDDVPAADCPSCSYYHGRGDSEALPMPGRSGDALAATLAESAQFARSAESAAHKLVRKKSRRRQR